MKAARTGLLERASAALHIRHLAQRYPRQGDETQVAFTTADRLKPTRES
jgi:hypothetical protein